MNRRSYDMDAMGEEVERIDKTAHLKDLPECVRRRLAGMDTVHKAFLGLEQAYRDELDALNRKYAGLYAPVFRRRAALLSGEAEPTAEELADYVPAADARPDAGAGVRGVPYFWYHVLMNNVSTREILGMSDRDKEALKYLVDITSETLPRQPDTLPAEDDSDGDGEGNSEGEDTIGNDGGNSSGKGAPRAVIRTGYRLVFTFQQNPFFSDTVLTKTYHTYEDVSTGESTYDTTEATRPNWFPGKDLTVHLVKKTQRARGRGGRSKRASGVSRVVTVEEPCPSFFQFFIPPELGSATEMSCEDVEFASESIQDDCYLGTVIKDDIIPRALLWYRGECDDDDDDDEDDDGYFDDDDDDEDEYGDDDDDDEDGGDDDDDDDDEGGDTMDAPRGSDSGAGQQGADDSQKPLPATAGETPQECKQQ